MSLYISVAVHAHTAHRFTYIMLNNLCSLSFITLHIISSSNCLHIFPFLVCDPVCVYFLEDLGHVFRAKCVLVGFLSKVIVCHRLHLHSFTCRFCFPWKNLRLVQNMEVRKCVRWQGQELLYQSQEALLPGSSHWLWARGLSSILLR